MRLLSQEILRDIRIRKAIGKLPSWKREKINSCIAHLQAGNKQEYEAYTALQRMKAHVSPEIVDYMDETIRAVYAHYLTLLNLSESQFKERLENIMEVK